MKTDKWLLWSFWLKFSLIKQMNHKALSWSVINLFRSMHLCPFAKQNVNGDVIR